MPDPPRRRRRIRRHPPSARDTPAPKFLSRRRVRVPAPRRPPAVARSIRPAPPRRTRIANTVRTVAGGDSLLYPAAVRALATGRGNPTARAQLARAALTDREEAVLLLMARGLSNREIAHQLHIGSETVKTHVSGVLTKLGARDRTQAVILAYESGFLER
ncbi:hypothetical protein GPX89_32515 [Nocardia sp. ET3-3]|uniref:HTH luxR-type domain-containing protein n=1 Tax=Nocardia terrae TaxID=2675851 RepID=A0A7K1V653_9NOCA|nr:hypothetical protein [Nocardia terrae]